MDGQAKPCLTSGTPPAVSRLLTAIIVSLVTAASIPCCPGSLVAAASVQDSGLSQRTLPGMDEATKDFTLAYLRRTVGALRKAMDFFQRYYDQVNLDAVIGTRIVEGTLQVVLQNLERNHQTALLPRELLSQIQQLQRSAAKVSDEAEPLVALNQPLYYRRIGPTIRGGLWRLNYTTRLLPQDFPQWHYVPVPEATTEKQSDDCIMEFYGTSRERGERCIISDGCWGRMTQLGYSRYSLSHEIFYLQLGELYGCLPQLLGKLTQWHQPGLRALQDTLCGNMLREAEMYASDGYPPASQDIFMEHGALCGMYGYVELFRYDWLQHILSWQDPRHGCYRWAGWPQDRIGGGHQVRKREEHELEEGCLCHRTTVAAAALAQYLRYLLQAYVTAATPPQLGVTETTPPTQPRV